MRLTEGQKETLSQALEKHWVGSQACWICGNEDWTTSERLFEIREHGGRSIMMDGATVPLVLLTCPVCGNTVIFNAVALGVV